MIDLLPPTAEEAGRAVEAYTEFRKHSPVLVHCALGMARSAAVAVCILIAEKHCASMEEALERIRPLRPEITLSAEAAARLTDR